MELYTGIFSSVRTYRDIKTLSEILKKTEELTGKPLDDFTRTEFKKACRSVYRRHDMYYHDPLAVPVRNSKGQWRTVSDNNGEDGTDFIFWDNPDATDVEIMNFVYATVYCGHNNTPYDCSGKRVTLSWDYRRLPCGVAITHHWGLDI